MIKIGKVNESVSLNEALSVAKYANQGGPNKPFPDGSAKGDLEGSNKAITVTVAYAGKNWSKKGDYVVEAYFNDSDDMVSLCTECKSGKEAIALAEKLLKEVNDPMYDAKKVAKKYKLDYVD